ncbi:MAG: Rieske 2Fe-2S domain-containing protein [Deltaproteobacteria bacterium]|nr:Rieske 2Fe-2S domain-containing protein [Deltaproteobacteria bacterium]
MATPRPSTRMREQTYPPPFPSAWYRVAGSHELRRGGIVYRECLGTQLVLYRSDRDDQVHAMGAFCPHMGANLSHGRVVNGQLECPFHRWQLAPDGRVATIPYADRVPSKPCQPTWTVHENYGQIFVYHDAGGGARVAPPPPPYDFPAIDDIDSGRMVPRGRHDAGRVHMHLLEFAENSVDFQHFSPLHGQMLVPWTNIRVPFVQIRHEADWSSDPEQGHLAYFHNKAILEVFGRAIERTKARAKITFYGPASVVTFRIMVPDAGEILMFQTHLPVAPLEQQVDFQWFADKATPRWLVWYVVGNWISQWRNDIAIWENKIHLRKPLLVPGDGPIHKLRRWFGQFYPEETTPEADLENAAQ